MGDGFNPNEMYDAAEKIEIDIQSIDLMKSEFLNGKLRHSLVYSTHFK